MMPRMLSRKPAQDSAPPVAASGLRINKPGDTFEQEADRVADAVVAGGRVPSWSIARMSMGPDTGAVQRDTPDGADPQQQQQPEANNYADAGKKVLEAAMQTDAGKKVIAKVEKDPLVKDVKDFVTSTPGMIFAGTAAAGVVGGLAAAHKPLPMQIPAVPVDSVIPALKGVKAQISVQGPLNRPTQITIGFSGTFGGGSSDKKKKDDASGQLARETRDLKASMDMFKPKGQSGSDDIGELLKMGQGAATPGFGMQDFGGPRKAAPLVGTQGTPLAPIRDVPPAADAGKDSPAKKEDEVPIQRKADGNVPELQRKAAAGPAESTAPPIVNEVLNSSGRPLDAETRSYFEPRLGVDLSGVRAHSDTRAAESASSVGALAYTVGENIVFGAGHYAPDTAQGKKLLAHELVHVVQQNPSGQHKSAPAPRIHARPDRRVMRQTPPVTGPGTPGFRQARGTAGEQGMAFEGYPAEEGWVFLEGPSGSSGHAWNQPGFDGAAFKPKGTFEMDLIDNKSWASPNDVGSSSALTRNIGKNLDGLISRAADPSLDGLDGIQAARTALANARAAITAGQPLPSNVRLVVTNYGGRSPNITASLRAQGVVFRNLTTNPRTAIAAATPPAPVTAAPTTPATAGGAAGQTAAAPPTVEPGTANVAPGAADPAQVQTPSPNAAGNVAGDAPVQTPVPKVPGGAGGEAPVDTTVPKAPGPVVGEGPIDLPVPKTAGAAPIEEAGVTGGGMGIAGIAVGMVVELAIGIAVGLFLGWLKDKAEKAAMERDIRALNPQVNAQIQQHAAEIAEMQKGGKKIYARISIDVQREEGITAEEGMPIQLDQYMLTSLVGSVDVINEEVAPQQSRREVPIPLNPGLSIVHYQETYSVLVDDPQKRALDRQHRQGKGTPAGSHATPPGVKQPAPLQDFPSIEEQQGTQPCPTCHSGDQKDDHGSMIPPEFKKPMMTEEEMRAWLAATGQ